MARSLPRFSSRSTRPHCSPNPAPAPSPSSRPQHPVTRPQAPAQWRAGRRSLGGHDVAAHRCRCRADGRGNLRSHAFALTQISHLDRINDEPLRQAAKGERDSECRIEPETVRARGRTCAGCGPGGIRCRPWSRPVKHKSVVPPRLRRVRPHGIHDDRERSIRPRLDEPGRITIAHHQFNAAGQLPVQPLNHCWSDVVIAACLPDRATGRLLTQFGQVVSAGQPGGAGGGLGPTSDNPFRSVIVRAVEIVYAMEESLRIIEAYQQPRTFALDP